jgi:hypothetical protein
MGDGETRGPRYALEGTESGQQDLQSPRGEAQDPRNRAMPGA